MTNRNLLTLVVLLYSTIYSSASFSGRNVKASVCEGTDPGRITYFPVPGNCNQYVMCFNDVETHFECPGELWWHQEITNCDYPGDYCTPGETGTPPPPPTTTTTTPTPTPTPTPTETTQPPTDPPNTGGDPRCFDDSTQYWPHPALCNRYIECYLGDSYEMACPPGLFFSESSKTCVDPSQSECCVADPQCY